jgi:hypothetical protein
MLWTVDSVGINCKYVDSLQDHDASLSSLNPGISSCYRQAELLLYCRIPGHTVGTA